MQNWQHALKHAITSLDELTSVLQLNPEELPVSLAASEDFALRVPREFVQRMEIGNPQDPLLLQVLPLEQELIPTPGFSLDPLAEQQANPIPGLLHKYHGRALLITAGSCAINCRYCFRRHFPYQQNATNFEPALNYLKQHREIEEIILSGGEPLLLKDDKLAQLFDQLNQIEHLTTIRIHTRLPIVIPARITDELTELFEQSRCKVVMVIHVNHANEIDAEVKQALSKLKNITLLNQSVILKGVNDSAAALINLSKALFSTNVLPYYLHLLDPVQGTAHFLVDDTKALELVDDITQQLPGYLVPTLVREIAGEKAKTRVKLLR